MPRAVGVFMLLFFALHGSAKAENSEDIIAGSDVALTGGAVVANVQTGGAMWFNPAGVARLDGRSVGLTGAVLSYSRTRAPGILSSESGARSDGVFSAVQAIPRALTFVMSPRPSLRWGIGLFFTRSFDKFFQDSLTVAPGTPETSEFFATADSERSLYHISGTVAWKKSERFLFGGGLDIVIASQRLSETVSGAYGEDGNGGTFSQSLNLDQSGGGLQMKVGLQWAPVPRFRFGWMVATPTYLVYLSEEGTRTESISPPAGPPVFRGTQIDEIRGTWSGVETGLTRVGGAFLERWGWIELDLIVRFPLRTPELGIDLKTKADVRLGGVFRLTKRLKLGAGFFTDFSPERGLDEFADTKINFYGCTLGVDFANKEEPTERGEDGFYLALSVALRYSHGRGELLGLTFPTSFPSSGGRIGQPTPVGVTVNEIGINMAFKAGF
ncbi:MAG: hypothetical protein HKN97_03680 [Myxococcales bacterium]|nr:hypothetical protein [Myxococcales bacterium]NNK08655.1 hypothetical protein [Myxococcales bacterium]NNK43100.1 hypothetical protein [Myxococcales bacterium]RZV52074.1 MAG: hypothetical protein EX268_12940 [Deltaproteobacteria bacterium]